MIRTEIVYELVKNGESDEVLKLINSFKEYYNKILGVNGNITTLNIAEIKEKFSKLNYYAKRINLDPVYEETESLENDLKDFFFDVLKKDIHGRNL